jgi:DNA-binding transcriptional LysR family regulator
MDWGDLRYFVAVARAGSLSAAARTLKTEHSTVARRVAALEASLGLRLFDRRGRRLALTPEGERMAELAFGVEDQVFGIERLAQAGTPGIQGVVRLSAPPAFAAAYLAPRLAALLEAEPGLTLELAGDSRAVSLSRREADIAVRLSRPQDGAVVARRVGTLAYGLYAAGDYLRRTPAEARRYVGYDDSLESSPQQRWLLALAAGRPLALRTNDLASLHQATAAGAGLAALPRFLGDEDPRLQRLEGDARAAARELWLLVHPDLRGSPRVRLVLDCLAAAIRADAARLDPDGHGA